MKYRMVKVKKAGGGHRMQRAMVKANGQLKFVKNRGGHSHSKKRKPAMAKKRRSTAITHRRKTHRRHHRSHRRRGGGGISSGAIVPVALTAAGLAFLTGPSGPTQVKTYADKVPGAKTFGAVPVVGGVLWGIDKLGIYRSKWFRLAGVVGAVAAAIKIGTEGKNFKFVGDDDIGDYDLSDVDDIGDDDMGDIGDDDLGDDDLSDADEG